MAGDRAKPCELDQEKYDAEDNVKIICLGDSAVGKSKLMERFLMDGLYPSRLLGHSRPGAVPEHARLLLPQGPRLHHGRRPAWRWTEAGQVFDVQRKITYKNLSTWYAELREFRPEVPCIVVANKIDADIKMTQKSFNFARKFSLPLYFVSAADGTNVVKLFNDAIRLAVSYKQNSRDFMDEVLQELENFDLEQKEENVSEQEQRGSVESPSAS
uniref:Rab-like protein 2B n=1 Tax=Equus asinus TaxID=9793 RepID=A0A9L0IJD7_EQUAS|nr:rab-like protein 2A isoform X5 [Equus asinus]